MRNDASAYEPTDQLYVWLLSEPTRPILVGELAMVRTLRGVSLRYADSWLAEGFALSEDAQQIELSPAFDVLPSGQALGYQQMRVGEDEADSTLENALSQCTLFSLTRDQAVVELRLVAGIVARWKEHFASLGVSDRDIALHAEQIDRPFLREQRDEFAR